MASEPASSEKTSMLTIRVGADDCLINTEKIPYFAAFARFQRLSENNVAPELVHGNIPFFRIINSCVETGYRNFFLQLPLSLCDYHTVCETLDYLTVDILKGQKLTDVANDLKKGRPDWYMHRETFKGRILARDAAFKLVYLFALGEFESDVEDSNTAFNATMFVVSHPDIFKFAARKVVRAAFEDRFVVTDKQKKRLDKWPIKEPAGEEWRDNDTTTDEEPIECRSFLSGLSN